MRRRRRQTVLAEVPLARRDGGRPGALGRAQLEAYAALAESLRESRSVFVTGPDRSDVALGLAAAATAAGRRVALLECDLAEPALAGRLGLAAAPGLHEYLRGEAEAPELLQPLMLAGPASGEATEPLVCVVAGEPEPAPVALLDSDRCDHAIERLRRSYELLVIAGPALSEDADSLRALAEHADIALAAGDRRAVPKRPPVSLAGLVLTS